MAGGLNIFKLSKISSFCTTSSGVLCGLLRGLWLKGHSPGKGERSDHLEPNIGRSACHLKMRLYQCPSYLVQVAMYCTQSAPSETSETFAKDDEPKAVPLVLLFLAPESTLKGCNILSLEAKCGVEKSFVHPSRAEAVFPHRRAGLPTGAGRRKKNLTAA